MTRLALVLLLAPIVGLADVVDFESMKVGTSTNRMDGGEDEWRGRTTLGNRD